MVCIAAAIDGLRRAGLRFAAADQGERRASTLDGQVWCVTGSFAHFKPRDLAMEEVKKRGGRVTSSVTSKTTHLLAGEGGGSKLEKAASLGVKIVQEDEFLKMLGSK